MSSKVQKEYAHVPWQHRGHQVGQGDGNRGFPQRKLRLVRTVYTDWAEVKWWEGRGKAFHEEAAVYTKGNVCD